MHRLTRSTAIAAAFLVGIVGSAGPGAATPTASPTLAVGTATLHRCSIEEHTVHAWCGSIQVPLNYNSARDGMITVGFAWLPATAETATFAVAPTLVAEEGGPGYPATGSAGDYQAMLGNAFLATHNMLVVDERGTGLSTLIDCRPLQSTAATTNSPALRHAVRSCGRTLNHEFPKSGGGFVHASDLFTTANSTRDMARVLNTLDLDQVSLYGDSYGTYFSQSFMSHFPQRLTSVTLDSAYEARDLDPWYRTAVTTARKAFVRACARSAACHRAADPAHAWRRIGRLTRLIRHHPLVGRAPGVGDRLVNVTVNVNALVNIVNDAGYDYDPYRQLDAAARAYLTNRNGAPLLRLWAQDQGYDYGGSDTSPGYYSNGQYFAISCSDYPQLFDMRDSSAQRIRQFRASVRHYPKHAFAPFTVKEWVNVNPFTEPYRICTSWPRQVHRSDPPVVRHTSMDASNVPVLILNGDLDSLTPAAGGTHIHHQIGSADSRHIITRNTVHLVAVDNWRKCGSTLVRAFISDPSSLDRLNAGCARRVPAVRTVGVFPSTVSQEQAAHGKASLAVRRLAAVGLQAAGDAAHRYGYINGVHDVGMYGGTISYQPRHHGSSITGYLHHAAWTKDSTVSGEITFSSTTAVGTGEVTVVSTSHPAVTFHISWDGRSGRMRAIGRSRAVLHAPAP